MTDLIAETATVGYKPVLVGDAPMAPYELLGSPGWGARRRQRRASRG